MVRLAMEDKPLTESINKQYSKYGSLRVKQESKIELCNEADAGTSDFFSRIDSSVKGAKAEVKKIIDKSTIQDDYDHYDDDVQKRNRHLCCNHSNDIPLNTYRIVKFNNKSSSILLEQKEEQPSQIEQQLINLDDKNGQQHDVRTI